ncbi:MAG: hypothetical protein ACI845_003424 [Gammaproteobacteria bacterium]|jgi:hypothetical protein
MDLEDKELMEKHQISSEQKTIYFYKNFKYDSLEHAVKYAEIDSKSTSAVES